MSQSQSDGALQRLIIPELDINIAHYMINHVSLPPQLLEEDDYAPKLDAALVGLVVDSLQEFHSLQGNNCAVDSVISMARNFSNRS